MALLIAAWREVFLRVDPIGVEGGQIGDWLAFRFALASAALRRPLDFASALRWAARCMMRSRRLGAIWRLGVFLAGSFRSFEDFRLG